MKQYYYSDGLDKRGPFTLEELKGQNISRNTMVWHYPMEKWLAAEQLPELQELFSNEPPSMQSPGSQERSRAFTHNYPGGKPPRTWLVESILVTIFCCLPFGIVGIVNAARVETRFSSGDIEGAKRSSREAGKWTQIGFWIGISGIVVYALFLIFAVAVGH